MKDKIFTRFSLAIILFVFLNSAFYGNLHAQEEVTPVVGEAIMPLNNKKDIYHKRNKEAREKLIQLATFDAIEKGAALKVSSIIKKGDISTTVSQSFEEVYEKYVSSQLTRYNVLWTRTSSYKFARLDGKKWKCIVEGEVRNLKMDEVKPEQEEPDQDLNYFITRKSFKTVHLNAGKNKGITVGDKFIVYRHKKKKTINGYNFVPKKVGFVTVSNVDDRFSVGKIMRGIYGIKEGQQASKMDFKTYRIGLEYQLSGSYEQVNTTDLGDKESKVNTKSHALYLYYSSYLSRWGFKFGLEVLDTDKDSIVLENDVTTSYSAYSFLPKFNLNYNIGIIPDLLYITPNASIGYLFIENGKEHVFEKSGKAWNADVVFEGDVSAHFRVGAFDFIGGVSYKYINDYEELTNFYPHVGIWINFVRYGKRGVGGGSTE